MDNLLAYMPQLLIGLGNTLLIALIAMPVGLCLSLALLSSSQKKTYYAKIINHVAGILRSLPELVLLFLVYFGSIIVLKKIAGHYVSCPPIIAGIVAFSLLSLVYALPVLQGALLVINPKQQLVGKNLGLSQRAVFFNITLPQLWQHALPGLRNLWLSLLKDTALVSLIGVHDLMGNVSLAANTTQSPFTFYIFAALVYLFLTSISEMAIKPMFKKMHLGKLA